MHFNPFIVLGLGLFGSLVAANAGYTGSCKNVQLAQRANVGWVLSASCARAGSTHPPYNDGAAVNIESCFANEGGNLVARIG